MTQSQQSFLPRLVDRASAVVLLAASLAAGWPWPASAGEGPTGSGAAGRLSASSERRLPAASEVRLLSPGELTEIHPDDSASELAPRINVPELLPQVKIRDWTPELSARERTVVGQFAASTDGGPPGVQVRREAWCLGFAFKPPRFIDVEVPVDGLRMASRRIWYLVYRVKNEGALRIESDADDAGSRELKRFERPIRFLPLFVLESREPLSEAEGLTAYRGYADRSVPSAMAKIERRERLGRPLLDTAAMSAKPLEPGEERWGVAIWEKVPPDLRFFSIVVGGLTNRFKIRPPREGEAAGAVSLESLRIDFWHRGDERTPEEAEIGIAYAGLFERMELGAVIVDSVGRLERSKASPRQGLESLRLTWEKLLEPPVVASEALDRSRAGSLAPLATAITAVARLKSASERAGAVRDLFGDGGADMFGQLIRGASTPVEPDRAASRREALASIGAKEDVFDADPLEGLALVVRGLDRIRGVADRVAAADAIFGDAVPQLVLLRKSLAAARASAVLETIGVDPAGLVGIGPRQAFDRIRERIDVLAKAKDGEDKADSRNRLVAGIFGAEGPLLFAEATRRHEGIDHEWFFQYETETD